MLIVYKGRVATQFQGLYETTSDNIKYEENQIIRLWQMHLTSASRLCICVLDLMLEVLIWTHLFN